jgi:hypothetical protein
MVVTTSTITRADIEVLHAWGIKLLAWQRLTEDQRIYYRTHVATVLDSKPCNV